MMQTDILVVEDNPLDLELTLHTLEREKCVGHIEVARDGAEALDFLFNRGVFRDRPRGAPRVVLLDLKLPKVDGIEVLKQIKDDPRTKSIPIVVFTSSHEDRDLTKCYERGANSYIQKPVNFKELQKIIRDFSSYWLAINQPPPGTVMVDPPPPA
jgi:CheY-like chemotaxis protein